MYLFRHYLGAVYVLLWNEINIVSTTGGQKVWIQQEKGFFEERAEGNAYHSSANVLWVKAGAVPGRNRPPCSGVDQHTLTNGSLKQCPPHLRTVHKQEDARTDLICNTDQKEIPALKFLKWSFLTSFASYWPVLSSSRGQRMYIFLCWKVALLAGTFWIRVLWSTLVGIPIKIIEQKHAQVL